MLNYVHLLCFIKKFIGFVVVSGGFLRAADRKTMYTEKHYGKSIADVSVFRIEKHLI